MDPSAFATNGGTEHHGQDLTAFPFTLHFQGLSIPCHDRSTGVGGHDVLLQDISCFCRRHMPVFSSNQFNSAAIAVGVWAAGTCPYYFVLVWRPVQRYFLRTPNAGGAMKAYQSEGFPFDILFLRYCHYHANTASYPATPPTLPPRIERSSTTRFSELNSHLLLGHFPTPRSMDPISIQHTPIATYLHALIAKHPTCHS